jgi:hypothetical protein
LLSVQVTQPAQRRTKTIVALALAGGLSARAFADDVTITAGFPPERYLPSNTPIELRLNRAMSAAEGRLALFVDTTDVTALFTATPEKLVYQGERYPLPAGDHTIVAWLVSPEGSWKEVGRFPFKAVSRRGFSKASITPTADLTEKGQLTESHRPDQNAPGRSTFQDGTMQMTIRTDHERPGLAIHSEGQITGVTFRNEALRFGEKRNNAPLIDLSTYRVDVRRGSTVLSVGHLGYGSLRHLVNGFSSRGVALKLGEGKTFSFQLAVLNGSNIVGWDNFLGLGRDQHRMVGATIGAELIPSRPGGLRVETTLFSGSLLPLSGFNQGSVQTAEKSRGGGIRVQTTLPNQRLTVDAGFTGSRFLEARDEEVEGGLAVTPIPSRTRRANYVDASLVLLQSRALGKRKTITNLSLNVHHERIEPLFRSVGVSLQSDLQSDSVDLSWGLGPFTTQLAHTWTHDNLAGIATILTTRTQRSALTIGAPLAAVFGASGRRASILPLVAIQLDQTHQRGSGLPPNSDFEPVHLPDQLSTNGLASLSWQLGRFQLGVRAGKTFQDNRQTGRERADFDTATNAITLGFAASQRLNLSFDASREENGSKEDGRRDRRNRFGSNLSWTIFGQTAIAGNISHTLGDNNLRTSSQRGTEGFLELASGFHLSGGAAQKRQGRVFVRFSDRRARSNDLVFGTRSDNQGGAVTSGLTFSLF